MTAALILPLLLGSCTAIQSDSTNDKKRVEPAVVVEEPVPNPEPTDPYKDVLEEAIDNAASAVKFSDSAVSIDDWSLAESRWERAIHALEQIPKGHTSYEQAQSKLADFRLGLLNTQKRQPKDEPLQIAPETNATDLSTPVDVVTPPSVTNINTMQLAPSYR